MCNYILKKIVAILIAIAVIINTTPNLSAAEHPHPEKDRVPTLLSLLNALPVSTPGLLLRQASQEEVSRGGTETIIVWGEYHYTIRQWTWQGKKGEEPLKWVNIRRRPSGKCTQDDIISIADGDLDGKPDHCVGSGNSFILSGWDREDYVRPTYFTRKMETPSAEEKERIVAFWRKEYGSVLAELEAFVHERLRAIAGAEEKKQRGKPKKLATK